MIVTDKMIEEFKKTEEWLIENRHGDIGGYELNDINYIGFRLIRAEIRIDELEKRISEIEK